MSRESRALKRRIRQRLQIKPGDIYEDCTYHPCLCIEATPILYQRGWRSWFQMVVDIDLVGISLRDLTKKNCSARHCAPIPLTMSMLRDSLSFKEMNFS